MFHFSQCNRSGRFTDLAAGVLVGLAWFLTADAVTGQPVVVSGRERPVRVGIVSAPSVRADAELLAVELGNRGVEPLERDELDRVLREQSLSLAGLTRDQSIRVGRLLKADGLLLLTAPTNDVRAVRLLAVTPGVVLWFAELKAPARGKEGAIPWPALVASALEPYLPKLAMERDQAIPVSLLRIRPAFDTPHMRRLAGDLNRLLLLRLLRQPKIFVLEREKLAHAADEFDWAGQAAEFWTASRLVEGVLSYDLVRTNEVTCSLSVRPPAADAATWVEHGRADGLADLVDRAVARLCERVGNAAPATDWDTAAEADRLVALAGGLQDPRHQADAPATALALGRRDTAKFFETLIRSGREGELGALAAEIQAECREIGGRMQRCDPGFADYAQGLVRVRTARYYHTSTREILDVYRQWALTRKEDPHHRVARGIGAPWFLDRGMADPVFPSAATEPQPERDRLWEAFIKEVSASRQPELRINLAILRLAQARRGAEQVKSRRSLQETLLDCAAALREAPFTTDFSYVWSVAFPPFRTENGKLETAMLFRRSPLMEVTDTYLLCWLSKRETSTEFGMRRRGGKEWRFTSFPFEVRAATLLDSTVYMITQVPRLKVYQSAGLVAMDPETLVSTTLRAPGEPRDKVGPRAGEVPFGALPFEFDLQVQDGLLLESNGNRIRYGWNPKSNTVHPVKATPRGFTEVDSSPYLAASRAFGFRLSPTNGLFLSVENATFVLHVVRDGATAPEALPLTFRDQPNLVKTDPRTKRAYFVNPVSYTADVILTPGSIFVPFFRDRGFYEIPYADIRRWLAANPPPSPEANESP